MERRPLSRVGKAFVAVLATASALLAGMPCQASGPEGGGWHHGAPFAYDQGVFDYLGFNRSELAENGVNVHLSLMNVYQYVADGGVNETGELSTSYDNQNYFDFGRMGLWENGFALVRAEGKSDDAGVNFDTGAIIPVNFDAMVPEPKGKSFEFTEWFYAHQFAGGKFEALVGMWDIARFFDIVPSSAPYHHRFLNAHMFFNSVLLRWAPYNILGGVALLKPTKWLTITTGIGDPNSSAADIDWFEEGDIDILHQWTFMLKPFGRPGWFHLGVAYTDQEQSTIAQDPATPETETKDDDWAYYGSFNQWLYQDPANPHRSIGLFGRVGVTNGDINIIERHYSFGVSFDGMIRSRPKDAFGIVGWYNDFSGDLSSTLDDSSEGFEAYYRFQATPWLQITPDVQYLFDPGMQQGNDDTLVVGARALINF
jgi:porin